jgi:hypothetical protein
MNAPAPSTNRGRQFPPRFSPRLRLGRSCTHLPRAPRPEPFGAGHSAGYRPVSGWRVNRGSPHRGLVFLTFGRSGPLRLWGLAARASIRPTARPKPSTTARSCGSDASNSAASASSSAVTVRNSPAGSAVMDITVTQAPYWGILVTLATAHDAAPSTADASNFAVADWPGRMALLAPLA